MQERALVLQSEFMADSYLRRAYISGFTGSAGSVVITKDRAALWTDGRYFLQVKSQLVAQSVGNGGIMVLSNVFLYNLLLFLSNLVTRRTVLQISCCLDVLLLDNGPQ